jgi:hypothetical protein
MFGFLLPPEGVDVNINYNRRFIKGMDDSQKKNSGLA